jgi:hypothetical protein
MKNWNRAILSAVLLALGAGAYCQKTNLLAKCLGQPRPAYAKAFEDKTVWVEKTPQGNVTVGEYKTGSAKLVVIQTSRSKVPNIVNAYLYQEPKYDWKLALKTVGLSSAGVVAKEDAKHQVHLSHIKAGKAVVVEAVYVPMDEAHPIGPELHLTLKKK